MGSSNVNLLARIGGDSSGFTQAIGEVNAALDAANRRAQATTGGFRAFGEQLGSIGSALSIGITLPVIGLGAAVINSAANMDSLKRGLIAVSGSSAEAERQLSALKEVAKLPGLGLKEAVQGSINLQAVGNSAEQSQRILKVFGNALATVGRGREDLQETIRQLGQLGSRGVVTADNLKPLIERIPQLSTIIREKFGPEALGNPAETFKKLGINSKEFIEVILTELGKLPMVTGGAKNAIENFKDAVDQTSARIGEKLLPAVEALLPKLEFLAVGVADVVDEFAKMSPEVQAVGIAIGAVAVAAGPVIVVVNQATQAFLTLRAAGIAISAVLTGTVAIGFVAVSAAVLVSIGNLAALIAKHEELDQVEKDNDIRRRYRAGTSIEAFKKENISVDDLKRALAGLGPFLGDTAKNIEGVRGVLKESIPDMFKFGNAIDGTKKIFSASFMGMDQEAAMAAAGIKNSYGEIQENIAKLTSLEAALLSEQAKGVDVSGNLAIVRKELASAIKKTTEAVEKHKIVVISSYEEDFKTAVLKERLSLLQSDYTKRLNDGVIALGKYKDETGAAADAMERFRITESAPILGGSIAFPSVKNLPKLNDMFDPEQQLRQATELQKLNEARNRARAKVDLDITRENIKDSLNEYKIAQAKIRQAISTITTDFSKGIADIITNGGKIGELFERLGKQIANTLIRTVIEGGINQVTKSLGGLLTSLGGVGAKVGGLFGGVAKAGSSAAIPGVLGGAANAAIPGITAGAPAASSSLGSIAAAANPIVAMVTAVSSVVSAISAVVANFQFAAMNKTLDLIEREVRYTKIYTGGQSNSILNTAHDSLVALRSIAASTKGLVGINISGTLNDAQTQRLIDDLLNGSGSFYAQSARTLTAILQALVSGFDVLTGQVNAANKQNIFQKIFSGGALSSGSLFGGLGQGLSGAFSSAVGGVINSAVGGAKESTLGAVEKEVRFSQIHLLNILEKMNQYLPKLADIHQRLVEIIVDGLKIREGGEGLTVNITVNGSMIGGPNVAAELSQMVVANLKLQGVRA